MKQTFTYQTMSVYLRRLHSLLSKTALDHLPDPERITFFELIGQSIIGKSLVADQAREAEDGLRSDGRGAAIRSRRRRAAMYHCMRVFHTGRKSVEDQPADFRLKNGDEIGEVVQVLFRPMNCRRKMAFEGTGNFQNLFALGMPNQ